jgi:hypothetical protein
MPPPPPRLQGVRRARGVGQGGGVRPGEREGGGGGGRHRLTDAPPKSGAAWGAEAGPYPPTPSPLPPPHQDGTILLANAERGGPLAWGPVSPSDYQFFNDHVPGRMAALVEEGHQIVIMTNQGNIR